MSTKPLTDDERDREDATVVECKCGRCLLLVVTSTITKEDALAIGGLIVRGCAVKHMPCVETRKVDFGKCKCRWKP